MGTLDEGAFSILHSPFSILHSPFSIFFRQCTYKDAHLKKIENGEWRMLLIITVPSSLVSI
jgi:hypothetical protein